MIIGDRGSIVTLLWWQKSHVMVFVAMSTLVTAIHEVLAFEMLELPTMPLAVVGAAIGIFVSFRTNSCYDRWWEGRKLWGRLINTSRHITSQSLAYFPNEPATSTRLIRRHIAYVHTLRCLLRGQNSLDDESVKTYVTEDERTLLSGHSNQTAALLLRQLDELAGKRRDDVIDAFQLQSFDQSIRELFDIQGGCERIKKTPLPRLYTFVSQRLIQWFSFLLPCAVVHDLGWLTIPVTVLVITCFHLINEAGRVLEDPFNLFYNALPLMALSRTIEINVLEMSGEKDLPEPTQPNPPFVLM